MYTKKIIISIILLSSSLLGFSQKTLKGIVIDIDSKEAVSFASIWIKNSTEGCLTQLDGSFSIPLKSSKDTVVISAIGYSDIEIPYRLVTNGVTTFELISAAIILDAAVVKPGKNPAIPIVKLAIKNRNENKPNKVVDIKFLEYNKLNLSFSNLDSSIFQTVFIKSHPEIVIKANSYDTTWSIPLFFSERMSFETWEKDKFPVVEKIIENQHGSSFIDSDITEKYINSLNDDVTFYGNLRFLSKDFISPISAQALIYYKYYLKDSMEFDNEMYYRIRFRPRNDQDLAFSGYMIIQKNTGVLTEIDATLQESANLNYVMGIRIQEKLQKTENNEWFYKQQKLHIEFSPNLTNDSTNYFLNPPMHAIKTTSYIIDTAQVNDYLQNRVIPKKFNVTTKQARPNSNILTKYRPDSLSSLDIVTREAIEVSNNIPGVKATYKIIDMLLYGYFPAGYVDIGPYLYMVQHNEIEGYRYNLSLRTSDKLSESMMLGGYLGYGAKDKKVKYGGTYSILLPTKKFSVINFKYDQNIYRIGDFKQNLDYIRENVIVQSDDNILSALTDKSPNTAVYAVKKAEIEYENRILPYLIIKPQILYSQHTSPPYYAFTDNTGEVPEFNMFEYSLNFRFSFKEEISNKHFHKTFIDSRYPVIHFNVAQGKFFYNDKSVWYNQYRFVTRHNILVGVGRLKYIIEAGLTDNAVPFPMLEFHRGNETGSSGEYYFNLMNYLEFASDRFVSVYAEYGMNGFILNKVPLLNKLQLRELLTFKACWGDMKYNHNQVFTMPSFTVAPTTPYMEAGLGVTNLFRLIRLEYIWRINYLNKPGINNDGFFFRFQFEF